MYITADQPFDIDEVQKIQDAFSKATGVASIITDNDIIVLDSYFAGGRMLWK